MSDILDNDKLQKILEAAENVPHGPWKFISHKYNAYFGNKPEDDVYGGDIVLENGECILNEGSADGEYSASTTPEMLYYISLLDRDTVTAMAKRIQELEKICDKLVAQCNHLDEVIWWENATGDDVFKPTDWIELAKQAIKYNIPIDKLTL